MAPRSFDPLGFLGRYWFPTALVLLLLLAVPGIVLFILNLCGLEPDVNQWLEENFQLSYSIPIPWWAGLILILVPLLILLLYFLKLKRKPLQVPSTFLWKKSIEDLHVNSLLQWLRQNVLLLLQLLTVLVLIYAIMAFRFHGRTGQARHYVIMIDNSASMSAEDVSPSRLEKAKELALKEIDAADDEDFGMVIVFNSSAQTLQSRTSNKDLLRRAVEGIQPTQRPSQGNDQSSSGFQDALSLADSLANPTRSPLDEAVRPPGQAPGTGLTYVQVEPTPTDVHLFSDGRFPDVRDFSVGKLNLVWHSVGVVEPDKQDNVGIVTMNASRDENDPTRLHVFIVVMNCRTTPVSARVQIEVQTPGDRAFYEKTLTIPAASRGRQPPEPPGAAASGPPPPSEANVSFELKDLDESADIVVHARLMDVRDRFPLDDEAWLVLGVVRKARILIVSKGNEILDKFFSDVLLRDLAVITRIKPDALDSDKDYRDPARNGDFDLVIFDRCRPKKEDDLPRGNTFFIGQPPPGWKRPGVPEDEGKPVEIVMNPPVKGPMKGHVLMRFLVALYEIGIGEAFRMKELPPRTPFVLESELETPLLLTLNRGASTDLVMTFPLLTDKDEWNTNWPLKPSFPLFLRNVLYQLGNVIDALAEDTIQPGAVKIIRPDVSVPQIRVRGPSGHRSDLERGARPDFTFGATDQVGVYSIIWGNQVQRRFAVNLLDKDESNLAPRASFRLGSAEVKRGQAHSHPRQLWKWIILTALLLLLLEWYIYNRRVYI
jgi:hypothetical protein